MDFWRTVVVLVRRWYVAVPTALVSLALTTLAYAVVPAKYESGCVLVLTTPLSGGSVAPALQQPPTLVNPLMNFDKSLSLTGTIIIQEMNSPTTASELGLSPGGAVEYAVSNGSANPELLETGPFIFVQGTGPTPEAAREITGRVAERVVDALDARQRALRAPPSTRIGAEVVVPVTSARPLSGSAARTAAAAMGVAVSVTLFAVYAFESWATRPRRGRP